MLAAEQIAMALTDRKSRVSVMIPHYAMSGGTLIALAATEIFMDKHSVLGPLDPQIQGVPAPALLDLLKKKPIQYIADGTIIAAEVAEKSLKLMKSFIRVLLTKHMEETKAVTVTEFLTGGYLTHDTPITYQTAKELELPVKVGIPQGFYDLLRSFRLGSPHRPSLYSVPCPCFSTDGQEVLCA